MRNATAGTAVERTGTLDTSGARRMGIDEEGMAIVVSLLSNLYSNPSKAVVREYACNARDSHVAAGQTRPIEVHLPSHLVPQLKIQDWGTGLTLDEIMETYAQYGASTKRDSDEYVGAFGIGSKSAFAVGEQFIVTAVKNGQKSVVLFALDEDHAPTVQCLVETSTDEPNGVLVDIAVQNVDAVRTASEWLFAAWPRGSVLVNGQEPASMWDNLSKLAEGVYVDFSDRNFTWDSARFKVVMGGVPYDIPADLINDLSDEIRGIYSQLNSHNVVYTFEVPIGAVDITPSREELKTTKRTRDVITDLFEKLSEGLQRWIDEQIQGAPNAWEAGRAYRRLTKRVNLNVPVTEIHYEGKPLGNEYVRVDAPVFTTHQKYSRRYYYNQNLFQRHVVITSPHATFSISQDDEKFTKVLVVTNVPDGKDTSVSRYAKEFLLDITYESVIAFPGKTFRAGWFSFGTKESPIRTIDFDEYRKLGLSRRKTRLGVNGMRNKTTYNVYGPDENLGDLTAAEINELDSTILWTTIRYDLPEHGIFAEKWKSGDYVIAVVDGRKSTEVFRKNVPDAERYQDHFSAEAKRQFAKITEAEKDLLTRWANRRSDYDKAFPWLTSRKHLITNQGVLDYLETHALDNHFTEHEQTDINRLQTIYAAVGEALPVSTRPSDAAWFKKNLPLLIVTLDNEWNAQRALGSGWAGPLIEYVNNTPVTNV